MAEVAVPVAPTGTNSATQTGLDSDVAVSGAPNSSPLNLFPQVSPQFCWCLLCLIIYTVSYKVQDVFFPGESFW